MKGIVSAGHGLTARAGVEMLEQGGNAFDAAAAAVFASFVCESVLTSPSGGGFFMAKCPGAEPLLYDFFSNVPGKGIKNPEGELDFYPVDINFGGIIQQLYMGRGAAAVPGCMAGLDTIHERHCTLPLEVILAPAISYAKNGVRLSAQQADFIGILSPMLTASKEGREVYAPGGKLVVEGDLLLNSDMAASFEHFSRCGLRAFYTAEMAGKILEGFGPGEGGLITCEDLETYRVTPREPLEVPYRGRRVYTNPPPSSGGCLAAFLLKLIEPHDLAALGYNTPAHMKLLLEAMRVTDEARREDFDHRIFEEGIAGEFLGERNVELYRQKLSRGMEGPLNPAKPGAGSTTHISVVDGEGNAASVTTSTGIGSGFMIPGTGIMMNNFLGEEDLNPRGFHTERPGTGISSMMAPTIVMNGDRPEIVLGTGGSKRIRNVIVQLIQNVIDHRMGVAQAVAAPRVHWDGAVFHIEPGVGEDVAETLRADGVKVNVWVQKEVYFGGVNAVCTDPSGVETGASDPRRGGVTMQVE